LATDPEARVPFPALPEKKIVGLERGPLSLVSTTEELLDSGSCLEKREYGRRDPWHFHFPKVRLTAFKEGAYFMGMKIFNHLPTDIKYYRIG
jgi:hypothetical protein